MLRRQLGASAFLWGSFGEGHRLERARAGVARYSQPPYLAKGRLAEVASHRIIGHFPENVLHTPNTDEFPQLAGLAVAGGPRDLSGMSGSGLWLVGRDGPLLAGILRRPRNSEAGSPFIEFVPIWTVREFLNRHADPAGPTQPVDEGAGP